MAAGVSFVYTYASGLGIRLTIKANLPKGKGAKL